MLEEGIECKRMDVLISTLWDSSHGNLLALAYMKMQNLLRNIKLANGFRRIKRHSHLRDRDEDLESIQPLVPCLPDSFKMHNLASSLDPFLLSALHKSPPHSCK